ncbi:uncharacterized protein BT62DRAFT_920743 [Guyanagaster necrorhizus]|uniref:Uncharacterized protein n=1 Tax=Guyanagaster necrorhizus TaxID=856835 RepID=A0A9P7VS36_9AGAR|nr:uncharacterized protein BT62DRAFT_920743 [Guyanagaster necrorhizus MCA 3950]KAG7444956.1 hypothetical protein BT62DRAFT_920743 [Guyanagaster necrorhizus MCA 3950]
MICRKVSRFIHVVSRTKEFWMEFPRFHFDGFCHNGPRLTAMASGASSSLSAAGSRLTTGGIEHISGMAFDKVISGTRDRYIEFCAFGPPPIGLGSPGDIYVDKTSKHHVLYGFTTKWERWNGPQKRKSSDFLRHPRYPNLVLWATTGKRGWISFQVIEKRRQSDTENNILTEQIKADEKNKVTGRPFQAERVQRQPAISVPQAPPSVGPAMVQSVLRETRRVSIGTASHPSPALNNWVASFNSPDADGESGPMLPIFVTESPMPHGQDTSISPMYRTLSTMPLTKSPPLVTDSPMSFTSSIPTALPVPPPTPNAEPPYIDLRTKINRSVSPQKSRTNASSSSSLRPFVPASHQPGMSSPLTKALPESQRQIIGGSLRPKIAKAGPSRPAALSSSGPQRGRLISKSPVSSATQKRKRVQSLVSEASTHLKTSSASSSLARMPVRGEARSRLPKVVKTSRRPSSVASPSKESASASRVVTNQCPVERTVPEPEKPPAVVIDLTLSDDGDVSVPTTAPSPQRKSFIAPSPSPRIFPAAPSPPPRVSLAAPSPSARISPVALSLPPLTLSPLGDASVQEDMPMGDDSIPIPELQYPEFETSETVPLLPAQYQVDFSDDATGNLYLLFFLLKLNTFRIVYGTLRFKTHHIHAIFQMNEVMVCRLCQEDQAVFDLDVSLHDLASHCEASHSEACHLIVDLTPEQTKAWLEIALVA